MHGVRERDGALEPRARARARPSRSPRRARRSPRRSRAGTRRGGAPPAPAGRACAPAACPSVSIAWSSVRTRCTVPNASRCASARSRASSPRPRGAEHPVGVGVVLEHAQDDLVRGAGARDQRRPRRYSSYVIRRLPSGCTSSSTSRAVVDARPPDREPAAVDASPGRRCAARARGRGCATSTGGRLQVELAIGRRDLLGVRHAVVRLRPELGVPASTSSSSSTASSAARRRPRRRRRPARSGTPRCAAIGPASSSFDRLVDRHAGLLVAGHDRPLDRGRTAPARQQRRMDVQPQRLVEERLGDQQAVGRDHDGVRMACSTSPVSRAG